MLKFIFFHGSIYLSGWLTLPFGNKFIMEKKTVPPQSCRIEVVAGAFNISGSYFGDFFKRNFGISYREYINGYRMDLMRRRIKSGRSTMKQITAEFGFADESHFSNYFKSRSQVRPAVYKKSVN